MTVPMERKVIVPRGQLVMRCCGRSREYCRCRRWDLLWILLIMVIAVAFAVGVQWLK